MIKVVLKHRERLHNHTETQPVRKYAQDDYFCFESRAEAYAALREQPVASLICPLWPDVAFGEQAKYEFKWSEKNSEPIFRFTRFMHDENYTYTIDIQVMAGEVDSKNAQRSQYETLPRPRPYPVNSFAGAICRLSREAQATNRLKRTSERLAAEKSRGVQHNVVMTSPCYFKHAVSVESAKRVRGTSEALQAALTNGGRLVE